MSDTAQTMSLAALTEAKNKLLDVPEYPGRLKLFGSELEIMLWKKEFGTGVDYYVHKPIPRDK